MIRTYISLPRVRDWMGYGIVLQCGTCEPLQSPTDVALEMSGSAELWRNAQTFIVGQNTTTTVIQQIRMQVIRKSLRPV